LREESEPTKGRLLIFHIGEENLITLLCEKETRGAVFSVAPLSMNRVVVGVGSKVRINSDYALFFVSLSSILRLDGRYRSSNFE
jgi:hypothetical protein